MSYTRNKRRHTSRADRKHHFNTPFRKKLRELAEKRAVVVRRKNYQEKLNARYLYFALKRNTSRFTYA